MATLQALKKKLSGVRSIQKFTKAMKNIATMKFSRLDAKYAAYAEYAARQRRLYEDFHAAYDDFFAPAEHKDAPAALLVIASNRGLCGAFNSALLTFAAEEIAKSEKPCAVYLCGKKAESHFREKGLPCEAVFALSDIPEYGDALEIAGRLKSDLQNGKISSISLALSEYKNVLLQAPALRHFGMPSGGAASNVDETLFIPDKAGFTANTADGILTAFLYEALLESAVGAEAATLMTMRSAYDTAVEYGAALESEINKKRQGKVTADVIETSRPQEEEIQWRQKG